MANIFISYSRKDKEVAHKLAEACKTQELDVWIDWEGIEPTTDWWKEIEKGIEGADNFLFLISPDSASSKICQREIEHAVKNGKRLVPVVVRDVRAEEAPVELRPLNWIFLRDVDDFQTAFGRLTKAIQTDYDWAQAHRELQVKALEWERSNHDDSFLLRGKELQDAELQLATNSSKEPHPTDLQREYVFKSRQASDRQRRRTRGIAIAAIIALTVLAVFGFVQAGLAREAQATAETNLSVAQTAQVDAENKENARATAQVQAEERAKIARAGELATQSTSLSDSQLDLASLLGIEAFHTWDNVRTRSTVVNNLYTNPRLRQYMFGHDGWISAIALNPKTDQLASGGCAKTIDFICTEGEIVLWDIPEGRLNKITSIRAHASAISSLAFNPQGTILATSGCASFEGATCTEGEIILWNTENYQPIGEPFKGHSEEVWSLTFSPNGKFLSSGSCASHELSLCSEGEILIWDIENHTPLGEPLRGHTSWVDDVAFSPDGHLLASGSADGTILLWDVQQGQSTEPALEFEASFEIITSLAFSPDGKLLVSGATDDRLKLWDVSNGELVREFIGHDNDVYAVAFSPDGKLLASGSMDQSIILWDTERGTAIDTLRGHSGIVTSLTFSHDGNYLTSASADSKVILWNIGDLLPLGNTIGNGMFGVMKVSFDRKGKALITESQDRSIVVSDLETKQRIGKTITEYPETAFVLAMSTDQKILAIGSQDEIFLWDLSTGKPLLNEPLMGHSGWITGMAFSEDKKVLASGGCENRDENLVCHAGKILLWDLETGQMIGDPISAHTSWVNGLAFSPDGTLLASGSTDGTILLWNLNPRQNIGIPFRGHAGPINSVAFSPDGKMLASSDEDGTIILWDVETHQPIIAPLYKQFSGIHTVTFSPNGEYLLTADTNGTIMLWEVDPNGWEVTTCQRTGRNFTQDEWAFYFPDEEYRITCPQWPAGK